VGLGEEEGGEADVKQPDKEHSNITNITATVDFFSVSISFA
jgi:hypothetical protein